MNICEAWLSLTVLTEQTIAQLLEDKFLVKTAFKIYSTIISQKQVQLSVTLNW